MRKITAISGAIAIIAGWAVIGASPAIAATHTYVAAPCSAVLHPINLTVPSPTDITVNVSAPATANSGATVTITFPAVTNTLPASESGATVGTYQDLTSTFTITGSTFNGAATHTGNATINGANTAQTEVAAGHTLTITNAGPMPPGNLIPAQVTVHTVAGAIGSTIQITGTEVDTTANLVAPAPLAGDWAVATCPLPGDVLSSTTVLAPPPPGAPTVQPDTGTSTKGAPATIDVLANDAGGANAPDPTTLAITTQPKHGKASVTSAHKILYTPTAGYSGIDTLQYHVCATGGGACAITVLNITVTAAPAPTTTTTTTTTTTVAPTTTTDPSFLARTGSSSSVPLSVIGLLTCALGSLALAVFRPRRDYRLPQ